MEFSFTIDVMFALGMLLVIAGAHSLFTSILLLNVNILWLNVIGFLLTVALLATGLGVLVAW